MYSGSNGTFDDEYIRYVLDTYSDLIIRLCYSYVKTMHDAGMAAANGGKQVQKSPEIRLGQ